MRDSAYARLFLTSRNSLYHGSVRQTILLRASKFQFNFVQRKNATAVTVMLRTVALENGCSLDPGTPKPTLRLHHNTTFSLDSDIGQMYDKSGFLLDVRED
jgi:hypothetical protein